MLDLAQAFNTLIYTLIWVCISASISCALVLLHEQRRR